MCIGFMLVVEISRYCYLIIDGIMKEKGKMWLENNNGNGWPKSYLIEGITLLLWSAVGSKCWFMIDPLLKNGHILREGIYSLSYRHIISLMSIWLVETCIGHRSIGRLVHLCSSLTICLSLLQVGLVIRVIWYLDVLLRWLWLLMMGMIILSSLQCWIIWV